MHYIPPALDAAMFARLSILAAPVGTDKGRITALTLDPVVGAMLLAVYEMAYNAGLEDSTDEQYRRGYDDGRAEAETAGDEKAEMEYDRGFDAGRAEAETASEEKKGNLLSEVRALVAAENDEVAREEYKKGYDAGYADGFDDAGQGHE